MFPVNIQIQIVRSQELQREAQQEQLARTYKAESQPILNLFRRIRW